MRRVRKKKGAKKALKVVRQGAVHFRGKNKKDVDNVTLKNLRTRAKQVRKKKCPPGYSKLKKAGLIKWIQKHGAHK